jgi:hypothetical protein
VVGAALDDERVEQVLREHPRSLIEGVRRLARTLHTEFLRVTFTPNPTATETRPGRRVGERDRQAGRAPSGEIRFD